ncbi:MAG TPA: hypothetical protein VNU19_03795 [Candidatus Acidoferrum sp.]|nr:hypothetical protein [Candidatus Acidoferrum sp.]
MTIESLLVVTGAGASRELGANRDPMPLMSDWCKNLITRFQERGMSQVGEILGLIHLDRPEQFEERLGRFLAWQRSLPLAEGLIDLGVPLGGSSVDGRVSTWFRDARMMADQITELLHDSLFSLFGSSRISDYACRDAYQGLFSLLDIGPDTPVAYATTNYDVAGETALAMCGRHPDWGEPHSFNAAQGPIRVRGLASVLSPYRVPVLHLHGRVGWYVDDAGILVSVNPGSPFQAGIGAPGLLLPDPEKNYAELPALVEMWEEFDQLIAAASHTIVIGHSLHDPKLVEHLSRGSNVVVTVYNEGVTGPDQSAMQHTQNLLPSATVVGMRFGPQPSVDTAALRNWLND